MTQKTLNSRNFFTYSNWKIVGIVDSDGSFAFRLTKRRNNKLGYNLLTVITQSEVNKEFLVHLRDQLGVRAKLRTTITGKLKSGEDKKSAVLDIAWTTPGGQRILKIFKRCPPRSTAKYRDYLIGQVFLEALQNNYILKRAQNKQWTVKFQEDVSAVASVLLSFTTSNQINTLSKSRKKESTPDQWFEYFDATPLALAEGTKIFQSYLQEIESKILAHENYLRSGKARLPLEYIRGFYIGDGCISISYNTQKQTKNGSILGMLQNRTGKVIKNIFSLQRRFWFIERRGAIRFKRIARFNGIPLKIRYDTYFSLTGDYSTLSLFEAVYSTFGVGNISANPDRNSSVYRIRGWQKAKNIVFPLLDNQDLPTFRRLQFQRFRQALQFFEGQAYKNSKNTKKLLTLIHDMNRGGYYRRKNKKKELRNFRLYFKSLRK